MSFSYEVKQELSKVELQHKDIMRAEAYGILLYCNTFSPTEVRIITGNEWFAKRIPRLFYRAFRVRFDRLPEPDQQGKMIFLITKEKKLTRIGTALGHDARLDPALHINFGLLEEEHCKEAFFRGAFFAGGSVTDPQKRYHLELTTPHRSVSREIEALLRESGLQPRSMPRGANYITYYKQSDQIEDFLTTIGAPASALRVMTAKLEKDLRNSVNRRLNCDNANLDKAVEAAQQQAEAIRKLEAHGVLATLPEKLRETAMLRLRRPELSIAELAEESDPPVTKSCMGHRLRKLLTLAETLE